MAISNSFEFDVIRNPVFGSAVLLTFCQCYYQATHEKNGPNWPTMLLVMPIVYTPHIRDGIYKMLPSSGLDTALSKNKRFTTGTQESLMDFYDDSIKALALAQQSNLLKAKVEDNQKWAEFIPCRKKLPNELLPPSENTSLRATLAASKRLGYWLGEINDINIIASKLRVNF